MAKNSYSYMINDQFGRHFDGHHDSRAYAECMVEIMNQCYPKLAPFHIEPVSNKYYTALVTPKEG